MVYLNQSFKFKSDWRVALGKSGQDLVFSLLKNHGKLIETTDWFDSEKDGIVDKKTAEVKTVMENYVHRAFIVGRSQWKKCEEVDRLFFARIPEPKRPIMIYECPKNYRTPPSVYMNGDDCRVFKLTNLEVYDIVNDEKLGEYWRSLTKTKYMRYS